MKPTTDITVLNPIQILEGLNIPTLSAGRAVSDVSVKIQESDNRIAKANKIIKALTGLERPFTDETFARITVMALVQKLVTDPHMNREIALDLAMDYTKTYMATPAHQWQFAKKDYSVNSGPVEMKAVAEGVDVKVAVKEDGTIKKGGKQVLAAELYKKHVLNATKPCTNQEFIAIIMKELGMTKAGATTYAYNAKKALGAPKPVAATAPVAAPKVEPVKPEAPKATKPAAKKSKLVKRKK